MNKRESQKDKIKSIEEEITKLHEQHIIDLRGDGYFVKQLKERIDLKLVQSEEFEVYGGTSRYYIIQRIEQEKKKKTWDEKLVKM